MDPNVLLQVGKLFKGPVTEGTDVLSHTRVHQTMLGQLLLAAEHLQAGQARVSLLQLPPWPVAGRGGPDGVVVHEARKGLASPLR